MGFKPRYFERRGGAVVESPLPRFEEQLADESVRGVTLADLDYAISEHLEAFEQEVGHSKFCDVSAALAHLEGAATAAIKKSNFLISRVAREQNRVASTVDENPEQFDMKDVLELFTMINSPCPKCGALCQSSQQP